MIVDAEFNEIEEPGDELDLSEDDSLPWLESDEDDNRAGELDTKQLIGFVAILLLILAAAVGLVYVFSNYNNGSEPIADGSTIEAPEGPYKERPDDAGGKEFPGTHDVAPGVGHGEAPEAQMADSTGAASGDGDLNVSMPAIEGGGAAIGSEKQAGANAPSDAANSGGVGVQLAAYSSRSRAQEGWQSLRAKSKALAGVKHRIVEGEIDIGTVYRLQAVAANRSEADALCRTLKNQGLDCQVKP